MTPEELAALQAQVAAYYENFFSDRFNAIVAAKEAQVAALLATNQTLVLEAGAWQSERNVLISERNDAVAARDAALSKLAAIDAVQHPETEA